MSETNVEQIHSSKQLINPINNAIATLGTYTPKDSTYIARIEHFLNQVEFTEEQNKLLLTNPAHLKFDTLSLNTFAGLVVAIPMYRLMRSIVGSFYKGGLDKQKIREYLENPVPTDEYKAHEYVIGLAVLIAQIEGNNYNIVDMTYLTILGMILSQESKDMLSAEYYKDNEPIRLFDSLSYLPVDTTNYTLYSFLSERKGSETLQTTMAVLHANNDEPLDSIIDDIITLLSAE